MRGSEIDIVHQNTVRSYRVSEQDKIVSYTRTRQDHVIHENKTRSYRTRALVEGRKERKGNAAVRRVCVVKMKSVCDMMKDLKWDQKAWWGKGGWSGRLCALVAGKGMRC